MSETTDAPMDEDDAEPRIAPTEGADRSAWLARIEEVGEDAGYFQPLGSRHWAFFSDDSPTLLVTFETAAEIQANEDQLPMGFGIAKARGWSHLGVIADGETWYRDAAIYRYFDRLVDDAFFEDFDRVVFYGAGMGAYAACAFSVTAPGATVLAIQPVATLDPAIAGWDDRYRTKRRLDFTDRYGFAPDMTEGTGEVYVIHDPRQTFDAMHAALFARPHVHRLCCPHLGARIETSLANMRILPRMIEAAGDGKLTPAAFRTMYRERRRFAPYLRGLLNELEPNRPYLAAMVARYVTLRMQAPRFRKRLAELEGRLSEKGTPLPPPRLPRGS